MDLCQRNINVSVHRIGDNQLMLWSTMLDLDHSIRVQLTVDVASKQIVAASSEMLKVPFSICHQTLDNLEKLKGMVIERGVAPHQTVMGGEFG